MQFLDSLICNESDLSLKLINGSVALFPTDTLPALASCPKFANKLWTIKKRSLNKPLILMGSSYKDLFKYVMPFAIDDAIFMAKAYWPGALTLVLPASGNCVNWMNQTKKTIGMRVPGLIKARELLDKTGPLATTSANLSGSPPAMNIEEAKSIFPEIPILGPSPWPKPLGIASTVIEWQSSGSWKLIRQGSVLPKI